MVLPRLRLFLGNGSQSDCPHPLGCLCRQLLAGAHHVCTIYLYLRDIHRAIAQEIALHSQETSAGVPCRANCCRKSLKNPPPLFPLYVPQTRGYWDKYFQPPIDKVWKVIEPVYNTVWPIVEPVMRPLFMIWDAFCKRTTHTSLRSLIPSRCACLQLVSRAQTLTLLPSSHSCFGRG